MSAVPHNAPALFFPNLLRQQACEDQRCQPLVIEPLGQAGASKVLAKADTFNVTRQCLEKLWEQKFVYIPGSDMQLVLRELGATDQDMEDLLTMHHEQATQDPFLDFRKMCKSTAMVEAFGETTSAACEEAFRRSFSGLNARPLLLSESEISNPETAGVARHYGGWGEDFFDNTAVRAYAKFYQLAFSKATHSWKVPENCSVESKKLIMEFYGVQVTRHAGTTEGEATPEGVHQDGTEGAIVTMLTRHNIQHDSGESRLWTLAQPNGKSSAADLENGNLLTRVVLRDPNDTIVMFDRHLKHDVDPFHAKDAEKDAQRNVMVIFARRPLKDGSDFE